MVRGKQTVLARDGLKPWRDSASCRGSDQLLGAAGVFMASRLPGVSKILHGLAYPRDSKFLGHANDGLHHFGVRVSVLVRVEMGRFDSRRADLFDLSAQFPLDGLHPNESGAQSRY